MRNNNNSIIPRKSQVLIAGITSLYSIELYKIIIILIINIITSMILYFYYNIILEYISIIIIFALLFTKYLYHLLYQYGKKGLKKHLKKNTNHLKHHNHQLIIDTGS